ncbi:MAG: phosphonate ABC transporter, permease protein PhnE [Anaerolineae bacterium]|nr:phosphonate ABC transporter, permease protein PhnE [Anaerolineae bacterium]
MIVLVGVIIVGLISGVFLLIGRMFTGGIPGYLSNMFGSIGELIELIIAPICGIIGAFGLASIGGVLTVDGLKKLDTTMQHVVGGVLGAICGAIVLGLMALIGMQAAWLGLLTPIVAGILGAQLLPLLYTKLSGKQQTSIAGRSLDAILWWVGFIAAFAVTFIMLNISLALIEGTLPPPTAITNLGFMSINTYIFEAMLIGLVLGGVGGLAVGTRANFSLGEVLYQTARTILNTVRAIEPLIIALIFSIWVGIGPFAGVLALTLHSIASLAKLYSEQIESIDTGPIEALQSTGANRLQTIVYAVVPQVVPPFVSFTMYRWDINVRMSTIIGFVGGGGIGFLLQQQINLLRYRDAGVAVLAIAIVVSILDYLSATIRERYV